jgi:methylmalonyl-CoA mutase cobalamin-binding subunit
MPISPATSARRGPASIINAAEEAEVAAIRWSISDAAHSDHCSDGPRAIDPSE